MSTQKGMQLAKLYQVNPRTLQGRVDFTKYQPKPNDLTSIHVEQEQIRFNKVTGVKESKPQICQYDPRSWNFIKDILPKQGWSYIRVLYIPEGVNYEWLYLEPVVEVPDHVELLPDSLPEPKGLAVVKDDEGEGGEGGEGEDTKGAATAPKAPAAKAPKKAPAKK